jgi:hypothetical protein
VGDVVGSILGFIVGSTLSKVLVKMLVINEEPLDGVILGIIFNGTLESIEVPIDGIALEGIEVRYQDCKSVVGCTVDLVVGSTL